MNFFRKSRPQQLFESLWVASFGLLSRIWESTLLIHSESVEEKSDLLKLLETKSERAFEISDEIFEMSKEFSEVFYQNHPEPYKEDWYKFAQELIKFQNDLIMLQVRLFLIKDVLMQIDESHPQWRQLDETLQTNSENLLESKKLIDQLINETSHATHNAIVIARSIEEDVSFEEADKRERKRWK